MFRMDKDGNLHRVDGMQAGRELDVKIAEALGLEVEHELYENPRYYGGGFWNEVPHFSTTWEGMGVLVEEARKQGIFLALEADPHGDYESAAWDEENWTRYNSFASTGPLAVCISYLRAKESAI